MGVFKICVFLSVIAITSSKPIDVPKTVDIVEPSSFKEDSVNETFSLSNLVRNQIRPGIQIDSYIIELTPDLDDETFEGKAIIEVSITDQVTIEDPIQLYVRNLDINSVTFNLGGSAVFDTEIELDEDEGILSITPEHFALSYTFHIEYTGSLATAGRGFYVGHYGDM